MSHKKLLFCTQQCSTVCYLSVGVELLMSLSRSLCSANMAFWSEVSMTGSAICLLLEKLTSPPTCVSESLKGVQFPVFDGSMLWHPNCRAFGLLFHPHLCLILLKRSPIDSCNSLYVRKHLNGLIPLSVSDTQWLWWTACWIQVHKLQFYVFHCRASLPDIPWSSAGKHMFHHMLVSVMKSLWVSLVPLFLLGRDFCCSQGHTRQFS